MEVNAKKILDQLAKRNDRERVSMYLSKGIYDDFRKSCGDTSPSQVIEVLMKQFVDSLKSKNKG